MSERKDPLRNFRFSLQLDNINIAYFTEVTVPDSTQDMVEYREGKDPIIMKKLPGLIKYGNLVLKKGVTGDKSLYEWRKKVEDGKMKDARQNITITLLDEEGNSAASWTFNEAWPVKYDAPDLNAKGSEVAVETLEIAHEGMKRN